MTRTNIVKDKTIKNPMDTNEDVCLSTEYSWKRWLSPDDLALLTGISKSTQSKMRMASNSSTLPFSKIGGKFILYDRLLVDSWLKDHQVQGEVI